MCGILGVMPPCDLEFFHNSLDTLTHRGPDGYGIYEDDDRIMLGHRRLAILDTSALGKQPMSYGNNRYHIVFNGEIYNFLEIRSELQSKGYIFRSDSDTEVLVASYVEWGEKCLLKFNGMWAFAIWDSQKKSLFLTRDRFGKKPLFYANVGNIFIFASEMKAIFPFLKDVRPSSKFNVLAKNIFSYEATQDCLVHGIKRFPAGHYAFLCNIQEGFNPIRYWNTLDHLITPPSTYQEQVEQFRELFANACKLRMRSDVPIGTALSGGLDSSATISMMAHLDRNVNETRASKDWQHAFIASFPNSFVDETCYAKKVVDYLGVDATFIRIEPLKFWDNIYDYFYYFEELYITSPIPMISTYKSVKKHGVSVTIDGHGADEMFSGYGHIREALWDIGLCVSKIRDVLKTQFDLQDIFSKKEYPYFSEYAKFMTKKAIKKILRKELYSKDLHHSNFKCLDNFTRALYIIFHETILPTLLRNYDRYAMINSVEIRMPFMDHELVSFVFSLPYSSKIGNGYSKRLIRDALKGYMPDEIIYRKSKIGFNSPIVEWMRTDLKEWFLDTVNSTDFLQCSLIENPFWVKNQIEYIINCKEQCWDIAENAWTSLIPYIWEKSLIKRSYK